MADIDYGGSLAAVPSQVRTSGGCPIRGINSLNSRCRVLVSVVSPGIYTFKGLKTILSVTLSGTHAKSPYPDNLLIPIPDDDLVNRW